MSAIDILLSIAKQEVGYLEKTTKDFLDDTTANAGSNNYTKYARDLDAIKYFNGGKQGVAWCAVFVNWCFNKAFGATTAKNMLCQPQTGSCAAGCGSAKSYFAKKGRFSFTPEVGDQIFFYASGSSEISHTGIVTKVTSDRVYTIEGNTSAGSQVIPNGGAVCEKSYPKSTSRICGYGHPDWSLVEVINVLYEAYVCAKPGETVNMRKSCSTNASVITKIPHGTKVDVLQECDSEWNMISYNGTQGYMMKKFISTQNPTDTTSSDKIEIDRKKLEEIRDLINNLLK